LLKIDAMLTTCLLLASIVQTAPFARAVVGAWTGTLQYRDYRKSSWCASRDEPARIGCSGTVTG